MVGRLTSQYHGSRMTAQSVWSTVFHYSCCELLKRLCQENCAPQKRVKTLKGCTRLSSKVHEPFIVIENWFFDEVTSITVSLRLNPGG